MLPTKMYIENRTTYICIFRRLYLTRTFFLPASRYWIKQDSDLLSDNTRRTMSCDIQDITLCNHPLMNCNGHTHVFYEFCVLYIHACHGPLFHCVAFFHKILSLKLCTCLIKLHVWKSYRFYCWLINFE